MDPRELPGDPETGLIEMRQRCGGGPLSDPLQDRARLAETRMTIAVTVPGETGTPNSSVIAWQVRFRDRNWPCHRYAPIPGSTGPYCTGALAQAGAAARVTVPHAHLRATSRCSVTTAFTGGRPVT